jgi:hypothetical protein
MKNRFLILITSVFLSIGALSMVQANEPRPLVAAKTVDVGSLIDAAGETETITVVGAALGDVCVASFGVDILDMTVNCYVQAANAVEVRVQNESGTTHDLASTTMRVLVWKYPQF